MYHLGMFLEFVNMQTEWTSLSCTVRSDLICYLKVQFSLNSSRWIKYTIGTILDSPEPTRERLGEDIKSGKKSRWGHIYRNHSGIPLAEQGYTEQKKKDWKRTVILCGLGPSLVLCDLSYPNDLSEKCADRHINYRSAAQGHVIMAGLI